MTFSIELIELVANSNIGLFGLATDNYAIFPKNTKQSIFTIAVQTLKVPIVRTTVVSSQLGGIFAVGNSKKLLLTEHISQDEYDNICLQLENKIEVEVFKTKLTALGNNILLSDKVALIHTSYPESEKEFIESFFGVETISCTLMGNPLIGSLTFSTSKGILVHPNISEEELVWLSEKFERKANVTTVNRGVPYPRVGIIANSNGALLGSDTTGSETMRIFDILS